MHLPVHDHRVHRAAGVVDHRQRDDLDRAGLRVDLQLAHLATVRERERRVLVHPRGAERRAECGRQLSGGGGARDVEDRDRPVGPDDAERAVREFDVGGGRLQEMGRHGRAKVLRDYDWEVKVDRMLELYEQARRSHKEAGGGNARSHRQ